MRLTVLPILALTLAAQEPTVLKAPITRVRLHPDEAWVTRVGHARMEEGGTHRIQIEGLPSGLRLDDLQVSAKGPAGTSLGDVSVQSDTRTVAETPEWKKLESEQDDLKDRRDGLESQIEALKLEEAYLKALQATQDKEISARMVYGKPDPAGLLDLGKALQGQLAQVLQQQRRFRRDLEKLGKEESLLQAEMQKQQGKDRVAPSRVTVEISTPVAGAVEVDLSYRNRQARWTPVYDARLSEDRKHLNLTLYAAVSQRSGEDWDSVRLEISNARPSRSLSFAKYEGPQSLAWIQFPANPSGREMNGLAFLAPGTVTSGFGGGSGAENQYVVDGLEADRARSNEPSNMAPPPPPPPPPTEAIQQSASVIAEASGLSTTFAVEGTKDVPSDGEPHRFKVLTREVEPHLALVTTPRLDATAFQVARFSTPGGFPLFPGSPVTQYVGAQRLGEAPLHLPDAGQPFTLGFGPYKGLRVSFRRADHKQETVGTFSKERQWTLRDELKISSDGSEPMDVEVQDRVLKSADDKAKVVALPETTPGSTEKVPGVRTWTVHLEPKGSATIIVSTQVRAPQDGIVAGLDWKE
ncbi:MAG: mucoidy inhibitor MuiA family protein [Acidobacteria bacterium]|nr:mucoidy inhibitor MuiA family protein [Acidobacteriota bacterium]